MWECKYEMKHSFVDSYYGCDRVIKSGQQAFSQIMEHPIGTSKYRQLG